MQDGSKITALAIVSITVLEGVALYTGLDGAMFMPVVAIISGLAGYKIKEQLLLNQK
ncbi:MAG: hypothetical protein J7L15_08805 [Clostridiales bacterium]|nr:hypothetical protein [Clostridiales bacterium]